jgi:hypothetical protein
MLLGHMPALFEPRSLKKSKEPLLEDGELFEFDAGVVL